MRVVDYFRFPAVRADEGNLFHLADATLEESLGRPDRPTAIAHEVMVFFDAGLLARPHQVARLRAATAGGGCSGSFLLPLETEDVPEQLARARQAGGRSLTLHPYLQGITRERTGQAVALARQAQEAGLFVNVCTAFGSREIYRIEPLRVAVAVCEAVSCPVILTHGGGGKVREAMLIADAFPQVRLDTSFSLPYWMGSSVEQDFAFAMRKLGAHRWMYGSDAPFGAAERSLEIHLDFFRRHGFSQRETEEVMGLTAARLLGLSDWEEEKT